MSVTLLRFIAMTLGPSITAVARPAATFLGVQLLVVILVHYELAAIPESMGWLVAAPSIVTVLVLAALETAAKHDPDIAAILRHAQIDKLTGAFGALGAALFFAALGMPEAHAAALVDPSADPTGEGGGILAASAVAAASEHSTPVQVSVVAVAVAINLGLSWLRAHFLEFVDDFELGRLWARIETGGVLAVLILLPLLPLFAFTLLAVFTLALAAVAFIVRASRRAIDSRARTDCEHCGYQLRAEASLCPECKCERTPTSAPSTGLSAAYGALFRS